MKLAIFDLNDTLTTTASGETFVQHPTDQILLPGVTEGIAALAADGYKLAIATNQGGVASGYKRVEDAISEAIYACRLTGIQLAMLAPSYETDNVGIAIAVHVFDDGTNRHHEIRNTQFCFRKPAPGMIYWLARQFDKFAFSPRGDLDILFIGDRNEDEQAARAAGVQFQWADKWRAQYTH